MLESELDPGGDTPIVLVETKFPILMNTDPFKTRMAGLPEEDQDALAQMALMEMKKRSRLEQIASGSMWTKLGLILPIVVSVAFFGVRGSLADYLPFIIVFLLFVIQGVSVSVHSRIDAVYELMRISQRENDGLDNQAKKHLSDVAP